jgi:predicted oxidoreductase (fatty acid repression mutant protein)
MKNRTISIRLNPDKLTDKKVEEILSNLPDRRKSEYIRNSIIEYDNSTKLLELLKQAVREAIEEQDAKQAGEKNNEYGGFNDYLKSL